MKPQNSCNRYLSRISLLALCLLPFGMPSAYSRDEVDSYQRLNYLNRATGNPSTTNTFQARLDSILNTTATPERTLVSNQDEEIRLKAAAAKKESEKNDFMLRSQPRAGKDMTQVRDTIQKSKTDMTEKNYQAEAEKLRKANLEKLRLAQTTQEQEIKTKPSQPAAGVSLALKNNPFYRGGIFSKGSTESNFEDQKPVILSRLIEVQHVDPQTAERLVSQASSSEELVISLMEELETTYQIASELAEE